MGIESKINYQLNKYPKIKKVVKRIYQRMMYMISPKIKSEGNFYCITPNDEYEYFFGYYDKSPWDATEQYMLCLRAENTFKDVAPNTSADILLIDLENNNKMDVLGRTHTWNVQQGCMLQWLGPDFKNRIIYNDLREGQYCSIIFNIKTKKEQKIKMPIYSVSNDGEFALSLDFSRLHRLRKGYGYSNLDDKTKDEKIPDKPCIWRVNLKENTTEPILKYSDFVKFEFRPEMESAEHKVNHIMISPNGKRFMVLHRWFNGERKYTRLVTANCDGTDMYNLSDDDMVSHCCWKSNVEVFAYERKEKGGNGYYLMKDKSNDYIRYWPDFDRDGHPTFSPNGEFILTDTYPDRRRMASIYVIKSDDLTVGNTKSVIRVFAPFRYDNDTRCDLHPRWNRAGDKICFDSVFEGRRRMYIGRL